jgi:hypothetical protein
MKTYKILMVAVITILSLNTYAQPSKSNSDNLKMCTMHSMVMVDKTVMCNGCETTLNLSSKEKMKWGTMKKSSAPLHLSANKTAGYNRCNSSNTVNNLNLSPKEKINRDLLKINRSLIVPLSEAKANSNSNCCAGSKDQSMSLNCPMISNSMKDQQGKCHSNKSILNLSSKEKMKRESTKV